MSFGTKTQQGTNTVCLCHIVNTQRLRKIKRCHDQPETETRFPTKVSGKDVDKRTDQDVY